MKKTLYINVYDISNLCDISILFIFIVKHKSFAKFHEQNFMNKIACEFNQ